MAPDWVDPVLELDPVLLPVLDEDPVAAPVGFEVVGTTAGTSEQDLSYATRFVEDCAGTDAAATE